MDPSQERRRSRRLLPAHARVWLVSGEYQELYTTANFAKGLLNVSLRGACVETTGRLRADLQLSLEVRFDDIQSALRTEARAVWTDTITREGREIHRMGLAFVGATQCPAPVRALLQGANPAEIMAKREREYVELKQKSEERKQAPVRKKSVAVRLVFVLLLLGTVYFGSFWALVSRGRVADAGPEIRYAYPPGMDKILVPLFRPAHALFRAAGLPLAHPAP